VIPHSTEEGKWVWKNVEFCTLAAIINGLHITLSHHLLSFLLVDLDLLVNVIALLLLLNNVIICSYG